MFNKIDAREWGDSEVNLDLTLCRQAWIFQATKIVSLGAQLRLSLSLFSGFPTFFFFCLLISFFLDHEARFFVATARKQNNLYADGQRQRQNS